MTDWVQDALGGGSYLVLMWFLILENLFPPIPSEIILPFAGALVDDGAMGFVGAVAFATLGAVIGALILYAIGRYGGRPLIYRHRRVLRVSEDQLDRADAWFDRRGPWIVLFGRLIPGVRSIVSIPAGASEMPLHQFIPLTALGSAAWSALLIGAGWILGANWEEAAAVVDSFQLIVYIAVALTVLAGAAYLLRRRSLRAGAR